MEIVTMLEQVISTVGFPFTVCGVLFWVFNDQGKRHNEEMNLMTEAYNNNTNVLDNNRKVVEKFLSKIGGE